MSRRLRVALLVEERALLAWECAMIDRIVRADYADVVLAVRFVQDRDIAATQRHKSEPWAVRAVRSTMRALQAVLDKKVGGCIPYALDPEPGSEKLLKDVPLLSVDVERSPSCIALKPSDIESIRSFDIDVLIDIASHRAAGEILSVPKFGIWSLPDARPNIDGSRILGYWEVFHAQPVTSLAIRTQGTACGDQVILPVLTKTCTVSVKRNSNDLHWKLSLLIPRGLQRLHLLGSEVLFGRFATQGSPSSIGLNDPAATPGLSHEVMLVFRLYWRIYSRRIRNRFVSSRWILLFGRRDRLAPWLSPFTKISPPDDRLWADPHVLFRDRRYYVFLEELAFGGKKGHVSVMELNEDGSHTPTRTVLEESHHLSNPFVFEHAGETFMVPESAANRSVDLYRCVAFPDQWKRSATLVENVEALDTTLHFHRGKWWLFTCIREHDGDTGNDDLFLFYADDLQSARWHPHPMNPIVSNAKCARPAGRIFEHEGKLYRPAQDCSIRYGYGIRIQEILELSDADYREKEAAFIPPNRAKSIVATHTISTTGNVVLSDALEEKLSVCSRIRWAPS